MSDSGEQIGLRIIEGDLDGANESAHLVKMVGFLDKSTIEQAEKDLMKIVDGMDGKSLVLDLEKLNYINSEGVGFLMMISAHLKNDGHQMAILKPALNVLDTFQAVGLDKVIPCCQSQEECMDAISPKS